MYYINIIVSSTLAGDIYFLRSDDLYGFYDFSMIVLFVFDI